MNVNVPVGFLTEYIEPVYQSILQTPTVENISKLINNLTEVCKRNEDKLLLTKSLFYLGALLKETDFGIYYIFLYSFFGLNITEVNQANQNIDDTLEAIKESFSSQREQN